MKPTPPSPLRLEYEAIRLKADEILQKTWPEGTIPINVERIVDARFQIDIIPVPGLKDQIGVEGFLSRDRDAIYVDERVSNAVPSRYRFTLAHEIGHLVLHEALYRAADFKTPAEWLEFQSSLPEQDYSRYEFQAYCFGGLLLAPKVPLAKAVQEAVAKAKGSGYEIRLEDPADRDYVAEWVGRRFGVSGDVIVRRGKYDGLWSA
jgi:Zn-dependent peptidase ImmA (M78 family)